MKQLRDPVGADRSGGNESARGSAVGFLASLAIAVMAVVLSVLAAPTPAHAQAVADPDYWAQTVDRQQTVYRFVYDESPQQIPTGYDPVSEAEQILAQRQAALPTSNPESLSLWQQVRGVTVDAALSAPLRALGTIYLAKGTFELGWKIGSGINAKFLHIGIPELTDDSAGGTWDRINWRTANELEYSGAHYPVQEGWVANFGTDRWFAAPCPFTGFSPPPPFTVQGPVDSDAQCWAGAQGYPQIKVLYAWAPENALLAPRPIEPYTDQSYNRSTAAPDPPPQATVEQSVDSALAKPENAELRQWVNYELGSPSETDPTGVGLPNPDIPFEKRREKWEKHDHEFATPHEDENDYWRDAADVIKKADDGTDGYDQCVRSNGTKIYWDESRGAIVFVDGGEIQTFFIPEEGRDYFDSECAK
jgi:hypothetical protein